MEKILGKIEKATFGTGGYHGAMTGLGVTLKMGCTGVSDFIGWWDTYPEHAKYTHDEWAAEHLKCYMRIQEIMKQAKCSDISKLAGTPIEVTLDGNALKEWRVLTEVL